MLTRLLVGMPESLSLLISIVLYMWQSLLSSSSIDYQVVYVCKAATCRSNLRYLCCNELHIIIIPKSWLLLLMAYGIIVLEKECELEIWSFGKTEKV